MRKLLDEQVKGGADNPAHELLMGLLKANPKQRFTINDVTASTFLTGGAALSTILGETKVRMAAHVEQQGKQTLHNMPSASLQLSYAY